MSAPVFQIEFTQDIKKPVLVQHCGNVVFTGDNLSDTISVSVLEDGEPYAISGTVAMNCIRADGATVTVTGSVSGNTASATLTQACVAIPGPLAVVIKVTSDTTTTTLLKAVYIVDVGVTGTAVDPGTIIPDVTTLINAIETAVGSIPADYSDLLATIAPNFVSGTYNKDQYVWNDGTLYRFTDNHSGSWTGTDVESVVIGDELTNLKNASTQHGTAITTLETDVAGKAPAIMMESSKAYYHEESPYEVTVYGNENASIPFMYSESKDIVNGNYHTTTENGVTKTKQGRILKVSGTADGGFSIFIISGNDVTAIAGKTVKFYTYNHIADNYGSNFTYWALIARPSNTLLVRSYYSNRNALNIYDVTIPEGTTSLSYVINNASGKVFDENDWYWAGLYKTPLTVTEETIEDGETYTFSPDVIAIDTGVHESEIKYIADTKQYIDEHTPDIIHYWNERIYLLPEDYGAKGDGVADDSTALNNCLADAVTTGRAVRGYKNYKVGTPVVINGRNLDIYINKINYTGSADGAVIISGLYNKIEFNQITSGGDGIVLRSSAILSASFSNVVAQEIIAANHGVVLDRETNQGGNILYNVFNIKRIKSNNGNCYHAKTNASGYTGENIYYNTRCDCVNGWAIYASNGRYFGFSLESNVKNGIYCSGQDSAFYGFRYTELVDKIVTYINDNTQPKEGYLLKFPAGKYVNRSLFVGSATIPYCAIDVEDAWNSDDFSEMDSTEIAGCTRPSIIDAPITLGNSQNGNGYTIVGGRMYIVCGRKICVPYEQSVVTVVNANYDMRESAMWNREFRQFATKFIIDVDDCVIHLPTDYCSVGYNEFIIDQTSHVCTVYKAIDDEVPIFDGNELGHGVYMLRAYKNSKLSYRIVNGLSVYDYGEYDTTDDVWDITKLS